MVIQQAQPRSIQRSFRLSQATSAALDEAARGSADSRNSLVERYLSEALRRERHPMVTFRTGGSGGRRASLLGTRLDVHRVVEIVNENEKNLDATARYLEIDESSIRAALDYYAEFGAEIDELLADEAAFVERERALWHRAHSFLT